MEIYGEIEEIKYKPFIHRTLDVYSIEELSEALSRAANFILRVNEDNKIALSWWVSPKRTRSYPYARVYDTLEFSGKKVTIIPIVKDEGKDGDRDFLQWDTVSLMSLLGVYVIIGYYVKADKNPRYKNKITNQRFDVDYIKKEIYRLLPYHSDALHWNLGQINKVSQVVDLAFNSYRKISNNLRVEMHSIESAKKRIEDLHKGKKRFMELSRDLAYKAQKSAPATILYTPS